MLSVEKMNKKKMENICKQQCLERGEYKLIMYKLARRGSPSQEILEQVEKFIENFDYLKI